MFILQVAFFFNYYCSLILFSYHRREILKKHWSLSELIEMFWNLKIVWLLLGFLQTANFLMLRRCLKRTTPPWLWIILKNEKYKDYWKADHNNVYMLFLNNISAGHTSLLEVYWCYWIYDRNYNIIPTFSIYIKFWFLIF